MFDVIQYGLFIFPRKVGFEPFKQSKFGWYFAKKIYGISCILSYRKITLIIVFQSGYASSTTWHSEVVLVDTLNRSSFQNLSFFEWSLSTRKAVHTIIKNVMRMKLCNQL